MKLLTKYHRANIIIAFVILLISSISYYFIIRQILLKQLDRDLKVEEQEIFDFIKEKGKLPNASAYKGQEISFEKETLTNQQRIIKSSSKLSGSKCEEEPVRMLTFPVKVDGVAYQAKVIKSQVEAEDLLKLIVLITGGIFLFLLVLTTITNRFVLNKLWQPFYHTLDQLSGFNPVSPKPLNLLSTNLSEFTQLNTSVAEMAKRVSGEFESLKTFADNASHEMQTPLAIINSKLDILIQNSTLEQAEQVQAIYNATGRLSKLNQTLLLLMRMENEQYVNKEMIDLKEFLQQKFRQFDELINARNIQITTRFDIVNISINKELADILLNNLLSNAIKHNYNEGFIRCILTKQKLSLSNTGPDLSFDKNDIFKRFQKSHHSDGTGLGLAVVKQICELNNFKIAYIHTDSEHTFTLLF